MIQKFAEGESVDFFALIKSASQKETKTGKAYLSMELMDETGTISGNLWDVTQTQIEKFVEGVVVNVTGKISSYQGNLQLNFQTIEPSDKNPADFLESAPVNLESVCQFLEKFIQNIQNEHWKKISEKIFEKHMENFKTYPAAVKVHHAYVGGLVFHTASMLAKAENLAKFYPFLNKELLCVGTLLHDVGKVVEMPGMTGDKYTTEGELLGHIEIILEEIVEICVNEGIDHRSEDVLLLKHVIAAHHGKLEWGTIATPRIPEASMLHMIDKMDAEMEQYRKIYTSLPEGEWTQGKEYFLGNTRVYRPNLT